MCSEHKPHRAHTSPQRTHFSPLTTGHAPCRDLGFTVRSWFRLQNRIASPCRGLTLKSLGLQLERSPAGRSAPANIREHTQLLGTHTMPPQSMSGQHIDEVGCGVTKTLARLHSMLLKSTASNQLGTTTCHCLTPAAAHPFRSASQTPAHRICPRA